MEESLLGQEGRGEQESQNEVWGWLQPGSVTLPAVLLRDSGVAIGRCKYSYMTSYWMQQDRDISSMTPLNNQTKLIEKLHRQNVGFVEVPDTRISRIHCTITRETNNSTKSSSVNKRDGLDDGDVRVMLRDFSSNGTFLNNEQINTVELKCGDKISLVMSMAPMADHFYTFYNGFPDEPYFGEDVALDDGRRVFMRTESLEAVRRANCGDNIPYKLLRTATTRYNGPNAVIQGEDDPICVICLSTPRDCVAVHPCGHSFCATCLSHHFGGLVDRGLQLSCPMRCSDCDRIVANMPLREALQNRAQRLPNRYQSSDTTVNKQSAAQIPQEIDQQDDFQQQQQEEQHPEEQQQEQYKEDIEEIAGEEEGEGDTDNYHLQQEQQQQQQQEEEQQQQQTQQQSQQQQQQQQQQQSDQISNEISNVLDNEEDATRSVGGAADRNTVISAAASNSPENTGMPNANTDLIINQIDLLQEGSHRSVKEETSNSQENSNQQDFQNSAQQAQNVEEFENSYAVDGVSAGPERVQSGNGSSVQKEVEGNLLSLSLGNQNLDQTSVQRTDEGNQTQNNQNLNQQNDQQQQQYSLQEEGEETQPGSLDAYMGIEGAYAHVGQGEESLSVQAPLVNQEQSRRSSTASSPFFVQPEVNEQTSRYAPQSNGHQATSYVNMPQILEADTDESNAGREQARSGSVQIGGIYGWGGSNTEREILESSMDLGMHESCPLYDENLPVTIEGLMLRQINIYLQKLRDMYAELNQTDSVILDTTVAFEQLLHTLEVLARLGWSEDNLRQSIAQGGGLECAVGLMKKMCDFEGVQCAVCLFLMAMVRGDSEICQANQWRVARENGVEAIVAAMRRYRDSRMVQLSCLLTLVPLAIENIMMQAHIARTARDEVVRTIHLNEDDAEIVSKGLLALGVLLQGSDVVHDAIRLELFECGVLGLLSNVMILHRDNEDLLWSAVFMSALMLKPTSAYFSRIGRRAVMCGLYTSLGDGLQTYINSKEDDIDEVIVTSGSALLSDLAPLYDTYLMLKGTLYAVSAGLAAIIFGWYIFKRVRW
eukprot:TRINITY_DN6547_c0_g2_i4.p1 TRINITY_DN6547_c0_g2~~TRINITY_DN6547_c0_g2_i4.p1  ORF type:complete len:1050 (-),score=222.74 TRINITY_DN6547_c0_g2_i4:360-3509(-)